MRKKGFTLIELLAVIVILAIIAVITIPTVMKVIENSKKGAAERSAENYAGAVENAAASYMMNHQDDNIGGTYTVGSNDSLTGDNGITLTVKVKGNKPAEGSQLILNENGILTGVSNMTLDGYNITYDTTSHKFTASTGSSGDTPVATTYEKYNAGDLVYFDPVSDSSSCSSDSDVYSSKRTVGYGTDSTSTCYKWRVIEVDDSESKSTITLQMDHNLTGGAIWVSKVDYMNSGGSESDYGTYGNSNRGPITALTTLNTLTASWSRVPDLNYTYDTTLNGTNTGINYGVLECENGVCTIGTTTITGTARARMITGEEVRDITNTKVTDETAISKSWTVAISSSGYFYFSRTDYILGTFKGGTGNIDLSWLIENTDGESSSGSTSASEVYGMQRCGYMTLSPVSGARSYMWRVAPNGLFAHGNRVNGTEGSFGIRPVITISKNMIG